VVVADIKIMTPIETDMDLKMKNILKNDYQIISKMPFRFMMTQH
jgi:hypothetical protein